MQHPQPQQPQSMIGPARQALRSPRLLPLPRQPRPAPLPVAAHRQSRPDPTPPGDRSVELAHDARNLISALYLYCDLIASPGVLAPAFGEYAEDLRRLADSGANLIGGLAAGRGEVSSPPSFEDSRETGGFGFARRPFPFIEDLASELDALEGPLQALAGPDVRLEIESRPCSGRLGLNGEDLLRILFNLVANAVEALASLPPELRRRPFLRITAQRGGAASFLERPASILALSPQIDSQHDNPTILLSVRDNGPGIEARHLPHIFNAGFSTRRSDKDEAVHGLGLAIVHRLVTAAGGAVRAVSPSGFGTRFDIELPIRPPEGQPEARMPQLELSARPEK